jgi:hypothetical protein
VAAGPGQAVRDAAQGLVVRVGVVAADDAGQGEERVVEVAGGRVEGRRHEGGGRGHRGGEREGQRRGVVAAAGGRAGVVEDRGDVVCAAGRERPGGAPYQEIGEFGELERAGHLDVVARDGEGDAGLQVLGIEVAGDLGAEQ